MGFVKKVGRPRTDPDEELDMRIRQLYRAGALALAAALGAWAVAAAAAGGAGSGAPAADRLREKARLPFAP